MSQKDITTHYLGSASPKDFTFEGAQGERRTREIYLSRVGSVQLARVAAAGQERAWSDTMLDVWVRHLWVLRGIFLGVG